MGATKNPVGWPDEGSALLRPAGWTQHRLPLWLIFWMGLVALLALGMAVGAAWSFWTGQFATGVPLAAGAIFLGHVVGLGTRIWWPRRRSSRTGTLTATPDGTMAVTFSYSAWSYYWLTAVLVMTELVALALTVGAGLSATVVGVVTAVVLGVLVLVVGWVLVTMLRLAPGKIVLSPAGVSHRGLTSTHFIPWSAIVAVLAEWAGTPIIAVKAFPSTDTRVRPIALLPGGAARRGLRVTAAPVRLLGRCRSGPGRQGWPARPAGQGGIGRRTAPGRRW